MRFRQTQGEAYKKQHFSKIRQLKELNVMQVFIKDIDRPNFF